jgi:hypothetical protein
VTSRLLVGAACALVAATDAGAAFADPTTTDQCVAANEDAQVAQRDGHLLRAREQLRACVAATCPAPVRADCSDRLAAVELAIPTLIIDGVRGDGSPATDIHVSVDGAVTVALTAPHEVQLDPGEHRFSVTTGAVPPVTVDVTVVAGERGRHVVARWPASPPASLAPREVEPAGQHLPVGALVLGGVGVAALSVGAIFWRNAISRNDASYGSGHCDASGCDETGTGLRNDALNDASIATVSAVLGVGALVAGGVVLYLRAPATPAAPTSGIGLQPLVGSSSGGIALSGAW